MLKIFLSLTSVGVFLSLSIVQAANAPDPINTPGVLCTTSDADFKGLDYPEQVARCNRNISTNEKIQVADLYGGIPRSEWPNYEFDHLIPLCAGGSNDFHNLWPEPIDQAHEKDKLEVEICTAMKAGTLKQADAVQKVHEWVKGIAPSPAQKPPSASQTAP